jgi:hypothetical protein
MDENEDKNINANKYKPIMVRLKVKQLRWLFTIIALLFAILASIQGQVAVGVVVALIMLIVVWRK